MGWWSDLWDTIFPHGGGNTRPIRANDGNSKKETEEKTKKESDK